MLFGLSLTTNNLIFSCRQQPQPMANSQTSPAGDRPSLAGANHTLMATSIPRKNDEPPMSPRPPTSAPQPRNRRSRRHPEPDWSAMVRSQVRESQRTGQACDRCKVSTLPIFSHDPPQKPGCSSLLTFYSSSSANSAAIHIQTGVCPALPSESPAA